MIGLIHKSIHRRSTYYPNELFQVKPKHSNFSWVKLGLIDENFKDRDKPRLSIPIDMTNLFNLKTWRKSLIHCHLPSAICPRVFRPSNFLQFHAIFVFNFRGGYRLQNPQTSVALFGKQKPFVQTLVSWVTHNINKVAS